MTIIAASTDYTDRDFAALDKRLRSLLTSVFPKWTTTNVQNVANLLRELYCFVGDVLGLYQDNQAGESRIVTATQMRNMIKLVKLLGYIPPSPKAATTTLTITLTAPVPSGRTVTFTPPWKNLPNALTASTQDTANPVEFELQAPIVIAAGGSSGSATVENSHRIGDPDDIDANPGEVFISTGLPNQSYQLGQGPYLDGSLVMKDAAGFWQSAAGNSLITAEATDRVYRIEKDENGLATVFFGDGVCGEIPNGTAKLSYKIGGGSAANGVARHSLKKIEGQFVDSTGASVQIDADGIFHDAPSGGLDAEDIETTRENAPLSIQTVSRTVTREDYQNQAILSGLQRALMITQSENASLAPNTSVLYCVPMGANKQGGAVTAAQIAAVKANITQDPSSQYPNAKPGLVGFQVTIQTAPYVDVGIWMRVYLKKNAPATTVATIVKELQAYFALRNADGTRNARIDFGYALASASPAATCELPLSDLLTIVTTNTGVREVGDASTSFMLSAYRVVDGTNGYTSGTTPAQLVQNLQHTDIPLQPQDFPRLKARSFGGTDPDIVIVDGDNADAQLYP